MTAFFTIALIAIAAITLTAQTNRIHAMRAWCNFWMGARDE